MPISDIPVLSVLRNRMQWQQERQRVLAENVANADTPGFKPKDLVELKSSLPSGAALTQPAQSMQSISAAYGLARTDPSHFGLASASAGGFQSNTGRDSETRPSGNAVNLEDEMLKVAANQMDYQAATGLYSRSLSLLKTAIGR